MLGLIIFGWPKKQKFIGTVSPGYCDHCQNQSMWHHIKTRRWITVFFLPIIPLKRANHWIVCDICRAAVEMDKTTAAEAKEMATKTKQHMEGEIPESEYYEEVERFADSVADTRETTEVDVNEVVDEPRQEPHIR